jgi:hypothetical protein
MYNFVENGKTYVRMELYIDDDVTDSSTNRNLVVRNNWKLASVVEDRGEWGTRESDFESSCGRNRSEILSKPRGTSTQNIVVGFRSLEIRRHNMELQVPEC